MQKNTDKRVIVVSLKLLLKSKGYISPEAKLICVDSGKLKFHSGTKMPTKVIIVSVVLKSK